MRQRQTFLLILSWLLIPCLSAMGQNVTNYAQIPDPFLFLLREPAIHQELQLNKEQLKKLVELNEKHDAKLLGSRNVGPEKSKPIIDAVFATCREKVGEILTSPQQVRLQQITYRMKGMPFVLLSDASAKLKLTPQQRANIQETVAETQKELAKLTSGTYPGKEAFAKIQKESVELRQTQQEQIVGTLNSDQKKILVSLVGQPFDLSRLGHVTFKAPEILASKDWINSKPLKLADLRGKVVALHFFAFG